MKFVKKIGLALLAVPFLTGMLAVTSNAQWRGNDDRRGDRRSERRHNNDRNYDRQSQYRRAMQQRYYRQQRYNWYQSQQRRNRMSRYNTPWYRRNTYNNNRRSNDRYIQNRNYRRY